MQNFLMTLISSISKVCLLEGTPRVVPLTIPWTALADFGDKVRPFPSHLQLSRSPKSATVFCRGRPYRPPLILKFVAVAEEGDTFLSRSPLPAAPQGDKLPLFVAVRRFLFFFTGRNANVTVFVVEQRESFLLLSPISVNNITHK